MNEMRVSGWIVKRGFAYFIGWKMGDGTLIRTTKNCRLRCDGLISKISEAFERFHCSAVFREDNNTKFYFSLLMCRHEDSIGCLLGMLSQETGIFSPYSDRFDYCD
jgi:hypothetical protein